MVCFCLLSPHNSNTFIILPVIKIFSLSLYLFLPLLSFSCLLHFFYFRLYYASPFGFLYFITSHLSSCDTETVHFLLFLPLIFKVSPSYCVSEVCVDKSAAGICLRAVMHLAAPLNISGPFA